ncbi:MAG: ATP-dependent helicase HrpB [Kordiimonas sp.]|nr:ATP-dependent helicase HrpB [Kordiimonas sp.]|tara:strand:+ start:4768 stop:7506 length:2739 start_codon:yes stop_codon:yes gene_type:complete
MESSLPIEAVLADLKVACTHHMNVVLQAPPGAGKTTRVPLALYKEPWAAGKILMLEPRRLAARAAASYMARGLGEKVGQTVGYRVRLDHKVGPTTRIEVITEAILIRMLQQDPELPGIAAVIFDEFHERSLEADLALTLCLDSQAALREDLRLIIMSATLDGGEISAFLGDAPVVTSEGRRFPVTQYWRPLPSVRSSGPDSGQRQREQHMLSVIKEALVMHQGNILVFLPGQQEIRRMERALKEMTLQGEGAFQDVQGRHVADILVCPLYGQLSLEAQDKAIAPPPAGKRKVVLATAIAETSLTIDGITVVVDGGQMRQSFFDPRTGMSGLETVKVTKAAAEQRAGRAGRLAPGACYRLWSEASHNGLSAQTNPEILQGDLAPIVLEMACWGVREVDQLRWLTPPEKSKVEQARYLLIELGALSEVGDLTTHGRQMARFGVHPRLSHMILEAGQAGYALEGCAMAALLSERDIVRRESGDAAGRDVTERFQIVCQSWRGGTVEKLPRYIDRPALQQVMQQAKRWHRMLLPMLREGDVTLGHDKSSARGHEVGAEPAYPATDKANPEHKGGRKGDGEEISPSILPGVLVGWAYPDRLARRRSGRDGVYLTSGGQGAALPTDDPLSACEYLAVARLGSAGGRPGALATSANSRVFLAAPLDRVALETYFDTLIEDTEEVVWDKDRKAVRAQNVQRLGQIRLREEATTPSAEAAQEALLQGVRAEGLACLSWDKRAKAFQQRIEFLYQHGDDSDDWPDLREATLYDGLEEWLEPYVTGLTRLEQLQKLSLTDILRQQLTWEQQQMLDVLAPEHITVPSGSRLPIDYGQSPPVLKVRLQEMFGAETTPTVVGGKIALVIHLLSPAGRPLQITQDLKGFWHNSYPGVRAEMRGRYPKHHWPEDPFSIAPTRRTKSRL